MISKRTAIGLALILAACVAMVAAVGQLVGQQAIAGPGTTVGAPQGDGPGHSSIPVAPALPAAQGTVIFNDDFAGAKDKSTPDGWQSLANFPGTWVAYKGRIEQWGNIDRETTSDPTILVAKSATFADGVYETQVFPMSGEVVGVVFRGSDAGYYRLSLYPNLGNHGDQSPKAFLDRVAPDGTATALGSSATWGGFQFAQWQRVEVRAVGARLIVLIDGQQLFVVNDAGLSSGWVGVWSVADRGSAFDNVRVQRDAAGR
jgi:hypothetical protein